jgi:hypothetical protein
MKIKLIILGLICSSLLLGFNLFNNLNKPSKPQNKAKPTMEASYPYDITSLDQLKNMADIIVKVQGTSKYKLKDYGGITFRISTLTVIDVIKGDKALKEINLIQTEGLDTEKPPVNGENLLMFLKKTPNIKDVYMPINGSEGTYDIVTTTPNNLNTSKSKASNNQPTSDENTEIKPNSVVNENVLKDLKGSYSEIKKKIEK